MSSASASTAMSAVSPAPRYLQFTPASVQAPLCRPFQQSSRSADGEPACRRHAANQCTFLHVVEQDVLAQLPPSLEEPTTDEEIAAAMRGVPFILFRLHPGEESQFSLLRRTLEWQTPHPHGWVHRTRNLRHALLHWSSSCPAASVAPLMRPDCRTLHFRHFTELTHKHRWQIGVRKLQAKLEAIAANIACPIRARQLRHALDFYPPTMLLPSERMQLLRLHESLGGQVDPLLREEALHPSNHTHKQTRLEKRSQRVGNIIMNEEAVAAEAAAAAAAAAALTSPGADSPSSSPDAALSPDAAAAAPLWLQYTIPDFLAAYPLHYSDAATAAAASTPPIWILKPYNRGSGNGIRVTDFASHVDPRWITGQFVASTYISRPLLIDLGSKHRTRAGGPNDDEVDTTLVTAAAAVSLSEANTATVSNAAPSSPLSPVAPVAAASPSPSPSPSPSSSTPPDLRKFDLRLYVLLLSPYFPPAPSAAVQRGDAPDFPFQVLLYTDGLARFASSRYDARCLEPGQLGTNMNPYAHITNNAVNASNQTRDEQARGCWENWSVHKLKQHFETQRGRMDEAASEQAGNNESSSTAASSSPSASSAAPYAWQWEYVWSQVRHLALHSLCTSDSFLRSGLHRDSAWCFELLGFDVLIDAQFKVHLCEINSMPDMLDAAPLLQYHFTYPTDHEVKSRMLAELFNILRFPAPEQGDEAAGGDARTDAVLQGFERLI